MGMLALVAVRDHDRRESITRSLWQRGWTVLELASGIQIVQALADVIIGNPGAPLPDLVVVDSISAGCSGVTIAAGLRELQLDIRVVLIAPSKSSELTPAAYAGSVILRDAVAASVALTVIAKLLRGQPAVVHDVSA
jgi:CheY-like chemotaxis protein